MQGVLPIAGELDSVAWLVESPALLPRLGLAFSLPGGLLLLHFMSMPTTCMDVQP